MFLVNRNIIMTSKKFLVSTIIITLDKQSESHEWSTQIAAK